MRFGSPPVYQRIIVFCFVIFSCICVHGQTVHSFSPTTICQGEKVTLTGTGFTGASSVQLGSSNAASFQVVDDNTIMAIVNEYAGDGPVRVGGGPSGGMLTVTQAPKPSLIDYGAIDQPFTNCDGNATYTLRVEITARFMEQAINTA